MIGVGRNANRQPIVVALMALNPGSQNNALSD